MSGPKLTALEVFKHTARTNCGECGLPNCMAFAAQVVQGLKKPADCPYIDLSFTDRIGGNDDDRDLREENRAELILHDLAGAIEKVDFADAARRLGGWIEGDRLALRCLGKIFELDVQGRLHSLCHINPWIHVSIIHYVLYGKGLDPVGEWTVFTQMKKARDWERFFTYRCKGGFHRMADEDMELFLDVLELFGAKIDNANVEAEYSITLYPLPKVPFLFCYTPADGKFESSFNLLFDKTIEENLTAQGTYLLSQGIVEMVRKIMARHTHGTIV